MEIEEGKESEVERDDFREVAVVPFTAPIWFQRVYSVSVIDESERQGAYLRCHSQE